MSAGTKDDRSTGNNLGEANQVVLLQQSLEHCLN